MQIRKTALSKKQIRSIQEATARVNIWEGSVRSGKTVGANLRWIEYSQMGPPGELVMIGKTERTLKRNIITPISKILGKHLSYNEGKGELHIGNRLIYVVGANDERSEAKIRGSEFAGAYGDELTLWPESFFQMLLSRLSVAGAKLFGTTNPDSPYHWLKKNYLDRRAELNLKSWHFGIDDNPFLPPEYVVDLKAEYTGLWYRRFILGLWVKAEGAIYDMWDDSIHVADEPGGFKNYFVSVDYGTSNPCTFGLYGYNVWPGEVTLVKEYYFDSNKAGYQKTDSQYGDDFEKWLGNVSLRAAYVDPSAASFSLELQRRGYPVRDADNDVIEGIRFVSGLLSAGRYRVARSCKNTIEEFSAYVWDAKAQQRGEDKPLKAHDHCMDRDRYGLYTHFGNYQPTEYATAALRRAGFEKGAW